MTVIEWKDAATHRTPTWPLAGYAPGDYMGQCRECKGQFINMDKRALQCLPCAIDSVKESYVAIQQRVRELETENAHLRATIQIVGGIV